VSAVLFESAGISNENDEWYTPSWMFKALAFKFDLDPCSPGTPPSTVTAKRHLTKADNGLQAEWTGSVWLNPPFSSKREWYDRLAFDHRNGIALMPARTETHDFQDYMNAASAMIFLRGRIYFERGSRPGAHGNGVTSTPPFGVVLCAYGEKMANVLMPSTLQGVRVKVWK
jgi:hypothetical protein